MKKNWKVEQLSKGKKNNRENGTIENRAMYKQQTLLSVKLIFTSWLCYFIVAGCMAFNLFEHHFLNCTKIILPPKIVLGIK